MRKTASTIGVISLSVFCLGIVAVPVSAESGSGESGRTTTVKEDRSGRSSDKIRHASIDDSSRSGDDDGTADQGHGDVIAERKAELKERSEKLLEQKRENRQAKSLELRQKACEARKAGLEKKVQNYSASATKHTDTFNKIYDRVLAYQAKKQLTVENFDALKSAVDDKKAAAAAAVAAISTTDTAVDCTSEDPAAAVAALKESVKSARSALHEYRKAIKDLVVALQEAKESEPTENSTQTTEGNQ